MRPVATALVLITCLIAAPSVRAEPSANLFGYFRAICGPDLDPGRSAARALAQGFVPSKKKPRVGGMDDMQGLEKTVDGREFFVLAGSGKEEFFERVFDELMDKFAREQQAIAAGTFHAAYGGVNYLVSGRKP